MLEIRDTVVNVVRYIKQGWIPIPSESSEFGEVLLCIQGSVTPFKAQALDKGVFISCSLSSEEDFLNALIPAVPYNLMKDIHWSIRLQRVMKKKLMPEAIDDVQSVLKKENGDSKPKEPYEDELIKYVSDAVAFYNNAHESKLAEKEAYVKQRVVFVCGHIANKLKDGDLTLTDISLLDRTKKFGDEETKNMIVAGLKRVLCQPYPNLEFSMTGGNLGYSDDNYYNIVIHVKRKEK